MEKIKSFLLGQTIDRVEFSSYQSPNDTLILKFVGGAGIKIVSDPNCCFDGLAFYVKKIVEVEQYEEIK